MLNQTSDSDSSSVDIVSYGQINGLKQLTNLRTLNRNVVEILIHSVQVYSGNHIEISWNFNEDDMRLIAKEDTTMRDSN